MPLAMTFARRLAELGVLAEPLSPRAGAPRRLPAALPVAETAKRIERGLKEDGAAICVNAEAWAAGGRAARLLLFVSPVLTPPAAAADLQDGLALPWKVLVQEDPEGRVWILWQDPGEAPYAQAA